MCRWYSCSDGLTLFHALAAFTVISVTGQTRAATQHTVVVVNSKMILICKTSSSSARWEFAPTGLTQRHPLLRNKTDSNASRRLKFDAVQNESVLEIDEVQRNDSGKYACLVHGRQQEFYVTVLDSEPTCSTHRHSREYNENESFSIYCHVAYIGNLTPAFQCHVERSDDVSCKLTDHNKTSNSSLEYAYEMLNETIDGHLRRKSSTFNISAQRRLHGCKIVCTTHFTQVDQNASMAGNTDVVIVNTTWSPQVIRILFGPHSVEFHPPSNGTIVKHGDALTCSADSYPTSSYEWRDLVTGSKLHNGSQLIFNVCEFEAILGHGIKRVALLCLASANGRTTTNYITVNISRLQTESRPQCSRVYRNSANAGIYFAAGCASTFVIFIVVLCFIVGSRSFRNKLVDFKRCVALCFTVENGYVFRQLCTLKCPTVEAVHEPADNVGEMPTIRQAVVDDEPSPPPLPYHQHHQHNVERPAHFDASNTEDVNLYHVGECYETPPPTEQPTSSNKCVVYAELAVSVRPERVRREPSTNQNNSNTAFYASIDHTIQTTSSHNDAKQRLSLNKKRPA